MRASVTLVPALLMLLAAQPGEKKTESGYGLMAVVPRPCPSAKCKRCDIRNVARGLAGKGARDCGWSRSNAQRAELLRCAFAAEADAGQFVAIESLQGIDSFIVKAVVRGPDGQMVQLWYDSDGSGANCPCSATISLKPCGTNLGTHPLQPDELTCGVDPETTGKLICSEQPGADAGPG